jgi:hypothetical protein
MHAPVHVLHEFVKVDPPPGRTGGAGEEEIHESCLAPPHGTPDVKSAGPPVTALTPQLIKPVQGLGRGIQGFEQIVQPLDDMLLGWIASEFPLLDQGIIRPE